MVDGAWTLLPMICLFFISISFMYTLPTKIQWSLDSTNTATFFGYCFCLCSPLKQLRRLFTRRARFTCFTQTTAVLKMICLDFVAPLFLLFLSQHINTNQCSIIQLLQASLDISRSAQWMRWLLMNEHCSQWLFWRESFSAKTEIWRKTSQIRRIHFFPDWSEVIGFWQTCIIADECASTIRWNGRIGCEWHFYWITLNFIMKSISEHHTLFHYLLRSIETSAIDCWKCQNSASHCCCIKRRKREERTLFFSR